MLVKCGVFLDSKKLKAAIETEFAGKDAFPKAVVIKLKTKNKKIIDYNELQIFAAWFDNIWQGNPIHYSSYAKIIKLSDGTIFNPGNDDPSWEYSNTTHFPDFLFSLFYYDALKVIFDKSICDGILISGSNCQFSSLTSSASHLKGESFVFKLESHSINGGGGLLNFGVPLYAVGLSCPPSWDANPCLEKATELFFEQMEAL